MSVAMNNLFNFGRDLPAPLDTLANKKVKVSSKYGSGTEATLTCTVVKAVHAMCDCMTASGEGAVVMFRKRRIWPVLDLSRPFSTSWKTMLRSA